MKRTPINKISKKRKVEMGIEAELRAKLLEEHGGVCQQCGKWPDSYGLSLHHILFKSRGGKSVEQNCVLICRECHESAHLGIKHKRLL
jgi:5-methylcytosine-specific restriction endonuclease McrA